MAALGFLGLRKPRCSGNGTAERSVELDIRRASGEAARDALEWRDVALEKDRAGRSEVDLERCGIAERVESEPEPLGIDVRPYYRISSAYALA
jgi:hypothetical protein